MKWYNETIFPKTSLLEITEDVIGERGTESEKRLDRVQGEKWPQT